MVFILDHLRSHVLEGPAEGVPLLHVVGLHAPAEVADFDDVSFLNQDIFGFDVPMD